MEYSPTKMKLLLEKYGFNFKKNFGQNFIIDENIIDGIINRAEIDEQTLVLEIGPGAGSLTYKVSQKAKQVVCYEIDTKLKPVLDETLKDSQNVKVIYQDFLISDVKEELQKYTYQKLYVVANLPYYITTPIIMKFIEDEILVDKIVVMVQKEVGDRFKAVPGTKDYSSLSVYLNYYFDIKKVMDISKNVFLPKPNVDSIIVEMKRKKVLPPITDLPFFFKLIRDSFKQKRKTLRNNLREYPLEEVENVLGKYGYDLSVRAEQLSLEVFMDMANTISGK